MKMPSTFSFRPVRLAAALTLALAMIPGSSLAEDLTADAGIALIEAPEGAGTQLPEGAFSLAPERHPAPGRGALTRGRGGLIGSPPVVIELFTSQGCSSCPPADALIAALSEQPGVLTLSWHVDYWDYLGWADSFARPEFTARQESYARAAGEHAVYTPQMIVAGVDTAVALGPAQLMGLIDASRVAPAMVSVQREATADGQRIELMPLSELGGGVGILLVRYAPERAVEMTAGENRGKVVTYTNVVLSLDRLAEWDGSAPLRMTISPDGTADDRFPADTRHALLVQKELGGDRLPGPILAAIRLD